MNKTLIPLCLALCAFAAVPQSLGQGELGTANGPATATSSEVAGGPTPIQVGLIGVAVVCFIAVRRLG